MSQLFYGDNLDVLRQKIKDESVDLIYLDPPFNSNATYNVLFQSPEGKHSHAQIEAFEDTWHWTDESERAFDEVMESGYAAAALMLRAMRSALGENDMMAYLAMMAVRLLELHRVLKPSGTLYLHCDPTASHYLKTLMDSIFGLVNFRNEIVWCYAGGGIPKKDFPRKHDVILRYTKTKDYFYQPIFRPYSAGTLQRGRTQVKGKYFEQGLRDEGTPVNDWWADVPKITSPTDPEKLGYPTQKPLALLERIIGASSKDEDTILDPFCGCGTTVHAAQKLGRRWLGMDITHLAIALIEKRLKEAFPGIAYEVHGTPRDIESAYALAEKDKHEFQKWIVPRIGGQLYQDGKKGMDRGVDGYLHFRDADKKSQMAVISVKGGKNINPAMIRDMKATAERENAKFAVFLTLAEPTREMTREAAATGLYETGGQKIPRLQILTIADIFSGKMPQVPFGHSEGTKKARRENTALQENLF